jgi:hypothetical protein
MPHYMLSVCYPAGSTQPSPEALERIMADVNAVHAELAAQGRWIFGGGLHPASTATTVLEKDGEALLTDGPFIESKEQIGGFSVVDLPDLDEAIAWARRLSRATTTPIEVRPFTWDDLAAQAEVSH